MVTVNEFLTRPRNNRSHTSKRLLNDMPVHVLALPWDDGSVHHDPNKYEPRLLPHHVRVRNTFTKPCDTQDTCRITCTHGPAPNTHANTTHTYIHLRTHAITRTHSCTEMHIHTHIHTHKCNHARTTHMPHNTDMLRCKPHGSPPPE